MNISQPNGMTAPRTPAAEASRRLANIVDRLRSPMPEDPKGPRYGSWNHISWSRELTCSHLIDEEAVLVQASGQRALVSACTQCGKELIKVNRKGRSLEGLPVARDNRVPGWVLSGAGNFYWSDGPETKTCERCHAHGFGFHTHHWAPHHLFDDANDWPTSVLCPTCHQEWHRVVTPRMGQKTT